MDFSAGDIIITKAAPEDAAELLAIQKLAYRSEAEIYNEFEIEPLTQTVDDMKSELEKKTVIKAVIDSKIAGSVRAYCDDTTCYIGKLFVHPDYQDRGLGTLLMNSIEEMFSTSKRYELWTGHLSTKNLALYHKLGYKKIRTEQITPDLSFVYLEKQSGNG